MSTKAGTPTPGSAKDGTRTTVPDQKDFSPEKPATSFIQDICERSRSDLERHIGRTLVTYNAVSYIEQRIPRTGGTGAPTLYYVNIQGDSDVYIHVKLTYNASPVVKFEGYQDHKKKHDPIVPF